MCLLMVWFIIEIYLIALILISIVFRQMCVCLKLNLELHVLCFEFLVSWAVVVLSIGRAPIDNVFDVY